MLHIHEKTPHLFWARGFNLTVVMDYYITKLKELHLLFTV